MASVGDAGGRIRAEERDHGPCDRWRPDLPGDGVAGEAFRRKKDDRGQSAPRPGHAGRLRAAVLDAAVAASDPAQAPALLSCDDDPSGRALYPVRVLVRDEDVRVAGGHDGKGNKMAAILSEANALKAIADGVATKGF